MTPISAEARGRNDMGFLLDTVPLRVVPGSFSDGCTQRKWPGWVNQVVGTPPQV